MDLKFKQILNDGNDNFVEALMTTQKAIIFDFITCHGALASVIKKILFFELVLYLFAVALQTESIFHFR